MSIVDVLLKVALLGSAWVLYLLLFLSVVSIGVMGERLLFFRRNTRGGGEALREKVVTALRANDPAAVERALRDSNAVEGQVVADAFPFRDGGSGAFTDALESELARARKDLDRGMNLLGTLGNNAPFIGLLGTVIGVIVAFHELAAASARAGAMGNVMAGIAEALVATGVGLFVALPAVIAYNIGQKRIGDIEQNAQSLGRLVSAWIQVQERGAELRDVPPVLRAVTASPERVAASADVRE